MKSLLAMACLALSLSNTSLQAESTMASQSTHQTQLQIVTASEMKSMMDKNPAIIVVDARTAQYDNKERIGNAISIPCDVPEATILSMLPNKAAAIIVYCGNIKCPQGKTLGERLLKLGYQDVKECPEGIDSWKAMGYSVTKAK